MARIRARWSVNLWMAALLLAAVPGVHAGEAANAWRVVPPEELAMDSEPLAAGASAVYLYTQIDRDDRLGIEQTYQQIKVLSEEGRNRANVAINYNKENELIDDVEARVIHPDGRIVPFSGKVYDRPLVENRELSFYTRSFTLEDVRIGSVIEYRYRRKSENSMVLRNSRWVLSQDLFTRQARYSLRMNSEAGVRWSWPTGLPEGTVPPVIEKGVVRMQIRNVPAFVKEDQMPPPDDLALIVRFTYTSEGRPTSDPVKYWNDFSRIRWLGFENMIGRPKDVADRLEGIIAAGDSEEQKLRKIYDHVRTLRNTDDPLTKEEKAKQAECRKALSARDVGKFGCGRSGDIQAYFTALLRAAGFTANPVLVAGRRDRFFLPQSMLTSGLTGWMVAVKLNGQDVYLEPGLSPLPFGALAWMDTASPALVLGKDGGEWITTPMPRPLDAVTRRKAKLALSDDGMLEGTVTVTHSGHEAIVRLLAMRVADEQTRTDVLKADLKRTLAADAEITVIRQPDWKAMQGVIETEYRVKIPQWAVVSGNRMLVGVGLFGAVEQKMFISPNREHPVYFNYPYGSEDQIDITLPPGFRMQTAPALPSSTDNAFRYSAGVTSRAGSVTILRALLQDVLLAKATAYPRFRTFYQLVRTGDQEQLVLVR